MYDASMFRVLTAALAAVAVLLCSSCHCHTDFIHQDTQAVAGGHKLISIQQMPYLVGIYKRKVAPDEFELICSGTLISDVHVVSAAHCFWNEKKGEPYNHTLYKVTAGKIHREWDVSLYPASVQRRDVANLTLHRRYLGSLQLQANDIAMVTLDSPLALTESVCVADVDWYDEWTGEQMTSGSSGMVAGWGVGDTGAMSATPQYVSLPYVDPDTCFDSLARPLKKFVTHDKFCAGYVNRNTSVCPGDSGGGLVFHHAATGKNFLRGVVSMAFRPAGFSGLCYAQHYAAFTQVNSEIVQILQGHLPIPVGRTRGFRGQGRGPGLHHFPNRQRHPRPGWMLEEDGRRRGGYDNNEGRRRAYHNNGGRRGGYDSNEGRRTDGGRPSRS